MVVNINRQGTAQSNMYVQRVSAHPTRMLKIRMTFLAVKSNMVVTIELH